CSSIVVSGVEITLLGYIGPSRECIALLRRTVAGIALCFLCSSPQSKQSSANCKKKRPESLEKDGEKPIL
ncbi:hypothetical protein, partial [Klebsiella quasipneumoniae]|uniref:hypothetical protein n=1 Tax=Klebsiella quasipneumoniae TaxID=1463165 RepID=UPI003723ABC6